jgi:cytosine/uracil/thiamine/allantoin permease
LLGPIGGILIADYFVCRRCKLNVTALYQTNGEYRFTNGFSIVALISLVIGVLPSLPGFGEHQRVVGGKHSSLARAPLQLRVVRRLRRGVHRLSRVAKNCAEVVT